jgi:hypothetical protein
LFVHSAVDPIVVGVSLRQLCACALPATPATTTRLITLRIARACLSWRAMSTGVARGRLAA